MLKKLSTYSALALFLSATAAQAVGNQVLQPSSPQAPGAVMGASNATQDEEEFGANQVRQPTSDLPLEAGTAMEGAGFVNDDPDFGSNQVLDPTDLTPHEG